MKNILSKGTLLCSFSSSFAFSLVSFCVLFGLHFLSFLAFLCVLLSNLVFFVTFCVLFGLILCVFGLLLYSFWSPFVLFLVSFCVIFGLLLYCSLLG